ncbi:MAG TPA: serine hydrolase, partial [bacterium]|nr:serine hydrolase [bacterium]
MKKILKNQMKKIIILAVLLVFFVLPLAPLNAAAKTYSANKLLGRLAIQGDSGHKLWYIHPTSQERWLLASDEDLSLLISQLGLTPEAGEFSQLALSRKQTTPASLLKKYAGQIIISPADSGQVFFLNKADGIMYQIKHFEQFYKIGRVIGALVNTATLKQLPLKTLSPVANKLTYDSAFRGVAYAQYDGANLLSVSNGEVVLPLASLTKLMTALVFLDTNPDWDKKITITPNQINYPCTLQTCGTTSEIDLKVGDQIKISDLWLAMLSASSNQASVILVDNSGLSREEFVQKMNDQARALGLIKTRFVEMSGLSADNVSTATEFAKIAATAFADPRINDATMANNYSFYVRQADGTGRKVIVNNRNTSLLALGPIAAKTGYLVEAQRNAAIKKNEQIIIALHCYSLTQRNSIIQNLLSG